MIDPLPGFVTYMDMWRQLDIEYRRTPSWRFIRQQSLLNRMHKLTKNYERWYNKWLENSNTQ